MSPHEQLNSTFAAHEDSAAEHGVYIFDVVHEIKTRGGTTTGVSSRRLRLVDGSHVERVAKGEYKIGLVQETRIMSDDPNAI